MKNAKQLVALTSLAFAVGAASAQFVKGNEAVKGSGAATQIVTPPLPNAGSRSALTPCAASAGCHPGPWYMVETAEGLRECTEPFARPTTCRASSYGIQRLSRLWIVKKGESWLWCQYPDMARKCVDMNARPPLNLPVSEVQ